MPPFILKLFRSFSNSSGTSNSSRARLVTVFFFAAFAIGTQAQTNNIPATQAITTFLLNDCGPQNQDTHVGDILIKTQADVDALSSVAVIVGDMKIESDSDLNFRALDGLVEVKGGIRFVGNTKLTKVRGFNCLEKAQNVYFYRNPALLEISGFNALESLSFSLEITNNDTSTTARLEQISGFLSLKTLGGGLYFYRLPFLKSIPAFPSLTTVGSSVDINRVTKITNISGFTNLVSVGRDLVIRRNNKLERITGFNNLTRANIARNVEVYSNTALDCSTPAPTFLPTTRSENNKVDCQ